MMPPWLLPFILAAAASPDTWGMPQRRDTPLPVAVNGPPTTTIPHAVQQTAIAAVLRASPLLMSLYALITFAIGYITHALWCRRSEARRNAGRGWRMINERELDLLPTTADPVHDGDVPPPRVSESLDKPRSSLQLPDRAEGRWRPLHKENTRRSHSVSSLRAVPPAIPRPMSPGLPAARARPGIGPSRLSDDRPLIDLLTAAEEGGAHYDHATNQLGATHVWASASNDHLPADDIGVFGPREWRHPVLPAASAPDSPQTPNSSSSDMASSSSSLLKNGVAIPAPSAKPDAREQELIHWSDSLSPPPSPSQALADLIRFDEERERQFAKDDVVLQPLPETSAKEVTVAAIEEPTPIHEGPAPTVEEPNGHEIPQCDSPMSMHAPLSLWASSHSAPNAIAVPDDDDCSVNFEIVTPTEASFSMSSFSPEPFRPSLPAEPTLTPVGEEGPPSAEDYEAEIRRAETKADAEEMVEALQDGAAEDVHQETDSDSASSDSEHDADVSSAGEDDEPELPLPSAVVETRASIDDDVPPLFLESPVATPSSEELPSYEEPPSPTTSHRSRSLSVDIASLKAQSLGSALPSPSEERMDAMDRTPTASKSQSPVETQASSPVVVVSPISTSPAALASIEVVLSSPTEKPADSDIAVSPVCQMTPAQTPTPPSSPPMPASASSKKRPAWSARALEAPQISYTRTKSGDSATRFNAGDDARKKLEASPRIAPTVKEPVEETQEAGEKDNGEDVEGKPHTPTVAALAIVRQSSVPGGFPGAADMDDEFDDPPLQDLPDHADPPSPPSWKFRFAPRPEPLTLDVALTMQLRPGLGVNSDPAWMVRFLMAFFGWLGVLAAGGEGF